MWTKVDDDTIDRLWDLSDAAYRLHLSGLIYSGRRLLDGRIPASRAARLVPNSDPAALAELVKAGYWRRERAGYQIIDGLGDQPSKAEVLDRRAATRERLARWRGGDNRPGNGVTDGVSNGAANASPVPSRPVLRRSSQVPKVMPARGASGTDHRNDGAAEFAEQGDDAWSTFAPEWDEFKRAWLEHGFRLPPLGSIDDPKSQCALLYEILDARPDDLVRWITTARGRTTHEVVGSVLKRWHDLRDEAAAEEELRQFRKPHRIGGDV